MPSRRPHATALAALPDGRRAAGRASRPAALYLGMGRAELDAGYDNAAAVPGNPVLLAGFETRSARLRTRHPDGLDLRYGPGEANRVDYFAAASPGPMLVFIHGGYWQPRAREGFAFVAEGPLALGMHVAVLGCTAAPGATLAQIVGEVRAGIGWVRRHAATAGGDPNAVVLAGWSAGGHLAAMCLDEEGVVGGLAISGIFDLEPIRLGRLNERLYLSPEDVAGLSPVHRPVSPRPLVLAYGAGELPELQRQSETFAAVRAGAPGALLRLPRHNHFTILMELARADGALAGEVAALARGGGAWPGAGV